uniref:Uncharacterized protein n=1 Tax=Biomphalaria glabrata TaxID=6526 RepID=A0A2C9L3Q9_BIOGL
MSEECDLKIMAIREDEKGEISDLKKENRKLYGQISNLMVEQEDLKEQVNNLKKKLEEEYKKYRDECDARKLLVADVNDLRYQQEDYIASKNAALMNQDTEEDPVIMKIALQKSREAETAATKRLNEMIANYGDVIPRRDFEMLEAKFKELEEKYEISQQDFRKMQAEYKIETQLVQFLTTVKILIARLDAVNFTVLQLEERVNGALPDTTSNVTDSNKADTEALLSRIEELTTLVEIMNSTVIVLEEKLVALEADTTDMTSKVENETNETESDQGGYV